jgi:hypothetical protein
MRYMIGAMPGLLLASSIFATSGIGAIRRTIATRLSDLKVPRIAAAVCVAGASVAISVALIFTLPAFSKAWKTPSTFGRSVSGVEVPPDWGAVREIISQLGPANYVPIGAVDGLAALYHLGGADFVIQRDDLFEAALWHARQESVPEPEIHNFSEFEAQGLPDFYSGLPVLTTTNSIREHFNNFTSVLIIVDDDRWSSPVQIDSGLKLAIIDNGVDLCGHNCGALKLFKLDLN